MKKVRKKLYSSSKLSPKGKKSAQDMLRSIKLGIAKRILSNNNEKWWTVGQSYTEIDTLRDKYSNENDQEKLKFLDELNDYVMLVQKKYENI